MKNKKEIINKIALYCCYACSSGNYSIEEKHICFSHQDYRKCSLCQRPAKKIYENIIEVKK